MVKIVVFQACESQRPARAGLPAPAPAALPVLTGIGES